MKVKKADGGRNERQILTGVITNRQVLAAVAQLWDGKLFSARWGNIIAGWCVDHYRKFRKPPGRDVASLFDRWAEANARDKDTVGLVGAFLADLSNEYAGRRKAVDAAYTIDLAKEYFEKVRLRNLRDELDALIADGDTAAAWTRVQETKRVEIGNGSMINPFRDRAALERAMTEVKDPVVTFPGALGEFFGKSLEREGFIAFQASEKRGKSTFLLDVTWAAMEQGRKVVMFQLGDLSQGQFLRRLYARACGRPFYATAPGKPLLIPNYLGPPTTEGGLPDVRHDERTWDAGVSLKHATKVAMKAVKKFGKDQYRLSVHPARSLSVEGVTEVLNRWEGDEGWKPDIAVFDYAELFKPMNGKAETRDQINATWVGLAGLRLEKKCLVVTATQADAASYDATVQTMSNFSEDKRKYSHVTGTVAINQTDEEKALGIWRLNWLTGRDWDYTSSKCVYVAGCSAIQRPFMLSTF